MPINRDHNKASGKPVLFSHIFIKMELVYHFSYRFFIRHPCNIKSVFYIRINRTVPVEICLDFIKIVISVLLFIIIIFVDHIIFVAENQPVKNIFFCICQFNAYYIRGRKKVLDLFGVRQGSNGNDLISRLAYDVIQDAASYGITFQKGSCRNEFAKGGMLVFFDLIIKIIKCIIKMYSQQLPGYGFTNI